MSWAAADETTNGDCQAEVRAVTVARGTLVPACLPGGMEDQDVHNVIQMPLDDSSVLATGLVGSFNATPAPVCPVNVILILSQAKWMRQVISYNLTVEACFQKGREIKSRIIWGQTIRCLMLLDVPPAHKG